jgi:hypothetical protein
MIEVNTCEVKVYVGMRAGYSSKLYSESYAREIIQKYCNSVGLGVTVVFGTCVYTNGNEPCVIIGFINYPRFPKSPNEVYSQAEELGNKLADSMEQERFTIVAPDFTRMYERAADGTSTVAEKTCPVRNDSRKIPL